MPAGEFFIILVCRLLLRTNPGVKIFGAVHRHPQKHLGMLRAAILRALPEINPRLSRIHPHLVNAIRNQISFPPKLGNPKTVVGV